MDLVVGEILTGKNTLREGLFINSVKIISPTITTLSKGEKKK